MHIMWILVICVWCLFGSIYTYSRGAPSFVCDTAVPGHRNTSPQEGTSPYTVVAQKSGQNVKVTIEDVHQNTKFKGFLLQVFSNDRNIITTGQFDTTDYAHPLDCSAENSGGQNSLTHDGANDKSRIVTTWIPPPGLRSTIYFKATVVYNYTTYWVGIQSNAVDVATTGKPPKITRPQTTATLSSTDISVGVYSGCGITKGCFGMPEKCIEREKCEVVLTYREQKHNNAVQFELVGSIGTQRDAWFAMALSRDQIMDDDSVTECVYFRDRVNAYESWNYDGYNLRLQGPMNITTTKLDYEGGVVTCQWTRPLYTVVNGKTFDIGRDTFYLLLAKGPLNNRGGKVRHTETGISSELVNFLEVKLIGSKPTTLVKVHGCLMTIAWVCFVSIAILMARHYKEVWNKHTLCGTKIWFTIHRSLMVTSIIFVIIGFVVIFVDVNGWSVVGNPHPILGVISTVLMVIQPVVAFLRPAPTSPKRPIFRWVHGLVGNGGHLIACINLFFAVPLSRANLPSAFYWVLATFIVFYCLVHLLIHVHSYFMRRERQKVDIHVKTNQFQQGDGYPKDEEQDGPGSDFKKFTLGLYVLVVAGLTIALVCMICLH